MISGLYTDDSHNFHDIRKMRNKYATTKTFFTFVIYIYLGRNWNESQWIIETFSNYFVFPLIV